VWTLGEMINAPTQTGLVVRLSPAHGRGRYQGMYTLSWSLAALVAPLMSGFVIDRYGAAWLWGLCAVVGTVAAVGYAALMRHLPEETAAEAAVPGEAAAETVAVGETAAETAVPEKPAAAEAAPA
jgi:MFS family permease